MAWGAGEGKTGWRSQKPCHRGCASPGLSGKLDILPLNTTCRKSNDLQKRAVLEVDEDNEEPRNGGAKRLRLSGDDSYPTQHTSHIINRPSHQNDRRHLIQPYNEKAEDTLAELEADLRAKQRRIDEDRVINREIRVREEQARLRDEEERARAAELREQQNRSIFRSNLHAMWEDYDRDREAAEERLKDMEREQREKIHKKEREAEEKRRGELNNIEASIKSMWDADDLDATGNRKIRPGQLSEAGQRRVRERQERLRRQGM